MAKIIEGKKIIFPICNTFATVEFLEPFDAWKKIWKGKKNNYDFRHLFIYVTVGLNLTKKCDFGKTTLLTWLERKTIFHLYSPLHMWALNVQVSKKNLHTWPYQKKLFVQFILVYHHPSLMMALVFKKTKACKIVYLDYIR